MDQKLELKLARGVSLEKNLVVKENWDRVLKHSSEIVMELRSFHWEEKSQVLMVLVSSHSAGRELGYALVVVVLPPIEMGAVAFGELDEGDWAMGAGSERGVVGDVGGDGDVDGGGDKGLGPGGVGDGATGPGGG
ncbi:hypothetical protein AXG93_3005s1020 [Marchantia polymorpha subsp. ruderalis]|uniref:Uncharacterized protein n=1 Tax=Marchantia polymorpha subsp. ruderalis TaxID=1480154 RepID=A0A176WNY7_MARPO|nr:hypothetical protein AXG93_3005s1020 [Marchantia polymorpha subsp. ruderalis]